MDPNVALARVRELTTAIQAIRDADVPATQEEALKTLAKIERLAYRLVGYVQALDDWLSADGFLPDDWQDDDWQPDDGVKRSRVHPS